MNQNVKNKIKIKKGDLVKVISGTSRGKKGRVLEVFPTELKARVEGVSLQRAHRKPKMNNQGGIITIEGKIHISNLAFCLEDGETGKLGYRLDSVGKKVRYLKKINKNVD